MDAFSSQPTKSAKEQLRIAVLEFVSEWRILRSQYAEPAVLVIESNQFKRGNRRVIVPARYLDSFAYMAREIQAQQCLPVSIEWRHHWRDAVSRIIPNITDVEFNPNHVNLLSSVGLKRYRRLHRWMW